MKILSFYKTYINKFKLISLADFEHFNIVKTLNF